MFRFQISGYGFRVSSIELLGFGFRVLGSGLWVSRFVFVFEFWVSGFGLWVSGVGIRGVDVGVRDLPSRRGVRGAALSILGFGCLDFGFRAFHVGVGFRFFYVDLASRRGVALRLLGFGCLGFGFRVSEF